MRAVEEQEIRHNMEDQGLSSYNMRLLEEYKNSSNEVYIISEQVDDVSISCDQDLTVECKEMNVTLKWNFEVETERQLVHVALLKQEPGASFTLGDSSSEPCIYLSGKNFLTDDMTYDITVSFTSINPGLYEQWLVLDFNMRPVLLKKLKVRAGLPPDHTDEPTANHGATFQTAERWHRGNRVIIPSSFRKEEREDLLKEYKPPQISLLYKASHNSQKPLSKENYKERMHQFLYNEELTVEQVVSRLNVCGTITAMEALFDTYSGLEVAPGGELFCTVSIPCNLTVDSFEGRLLKRSIQCALIAPVDSNGPNSKVYEASILQHKLKENQVFLQLSKQCCSDLGLKNKESYEMELQFQLNRYSFCTMHKAVDVLPDTSRVLPDLRNCVVPANNTTYEKLNAKQQSAINFITGNTSVTKSVAPLLIYGPFGTGKTFTLATAARELCKQPHNKVLICTYTNSSADLYVREHLHPFINKKDDTLRPIRIKANKQGAALAATDKITLKYCFFSDGHCFSSAYKNLLEHHNIVITTTSMARYIQDLKLTKGYFTHILIDEASQMLECEALMALGLAGPNTRVVLAGDHMQMGPRLFSVADHNRSNHTLLTRLFHYYQGQNCDAAQNSRIIFSENYRSTKEIVEFVSTHFYVGKNDVIKASGSIPGPENGHALKFYHVRGECCLETGSMTWYNIQEAAKVVEAVKHILDYWPPNWGSRDQTSICVLSEECQVRKIRTVLARKNLGEVCVQTLANVQGKQFRAVIITAVQTRDSLETSHLPGLGLFNDARVLNTAMTRAQSQVVVIGDAAALCCYGKCSGIWKSFINHCISNNNVVPQYFTRDFFEKDVTETVRFQKSEREDESDALSDAILSELKEELTKEYSSVEDTLEFEDFSHQESRASASIHADTNVLELCKKQPEAFGQGKMLKESYKRGYVIPFLNPTRPIYITGMANMGQAFTGDEVVVQAGRVINITKESESARILPCLLEEEDHSRRNPNPESKFVKRLMIPLTKTEQKIRILIHKKRRNFLPIWEKCFGQWMVATTIRLDENLRQNNVFMVQVISWKKCYHFPLGYVTEILPIGQSLASGLMILGEEFKVPHNKYHADTNFWADEDGMHRLDISDCDSITFTVDPPGSNDLDDAISVREIGDRYELGIHIADVASFVSPDSQLDMDAKECGATFYCSQEKSIHPIHMLPPNLSTGCFSLLEGKKRRVISLMFMVEKETNKIIGEPTFQLSMIKSNRQLTYDEAEDIITERYTEPRFDTVEYCVTVAYHFAQVQRRIRLEQEWAYAQTDDDRLPGRRKAHLMIEELSVLFNSRVAETLISSDRARLVTPLRCQARPSPEKLEEFKEKCEELIPLSFHLRHKVDHEVKSPSFKNFSILTNVWEDIQAAARADDIDKMVDLVAADDIHPLLQPVIDQFRKCSGKSYIIRSNSCDEARVGHYSLNLDSYTQASSPIRRYMDIILQRHMHSFICDRDVQYTRTQITDLCNLFDQKLKKSKEYEQKAEQIAYAVSTIKQSASKLGFIVCADTDGESFAVSFPFNKNIFSVSLPIMYKDLQLEDQPLHDTNTHSVTLKWSKRIYATDTVQRKQIHQELKRMPDCGPCIELPLTTWKAIIEAIEEEDFNHAKDLIIHAETIQLMWQQSSEIPHTLTHACTSEELEVLKEQSNHYVDIQLQFQPGDTLQVQITSEVKRGYQVPIVQLVQIKPKFEICVDHVHSPIMCFSRAADDPSRTSYSDTNEYVRIWKPICEMESAATAVSESENIIIENLVVNFNRVREGELRGSFYLPAEWIENWVIEFNLAKCLLCIRKRGLKLTSTLEHSAVVDPTEYTWVAHGVTSTVEKQKNDNNGTKVEFYVNHLPMKNIPPSVFQKNTCFTVEIVPKLLPDIRKEQAVVNIPRACELVQAIALGKHIPRQVTSQWCTVKNQIPNELPDLNPSQRDAVDKALNTNFTLIQGPPGTGKTVVGVYIVLRYFEENNKSQRKCVDSMDKNKKEVILYCGPSNKSVDVVAEYLVKFKDRLRPLRVYSQQVEMLEYPYPDGTLQFSRRTLRQDCSKPELRSITLHHRMREKENIYSEEIKAFDQRIRLALNKGKQLTPEEVKTYKKLLKKAREYELQRHNIILCTCAQSSSPSITETVSARQILIDECAMATEPQSMIPLVCNRPEKIVLIGDHKQLRPIVRNVQVKKLGMAMSLFERYIPHKNRAVMLNIQYRMHKDICEFPSNEFYEGQLQTGVQRPNSVLRVDDKVMPIVFGDVIGQTISLVVSTAKGNENSKANKEERDTVIAIAEKLVTIGKIKEESIAILSPYNAQVSEIKTELKKKKMNKITVTTITKSQGSEWRYILISTVCSLPHNEIESEPDRAWLSKHLGFVGDPNQTNVAITRAKEGLCIIGNQALLRRSPTWNHLLNHYTRNNAVADAEKISVQCASALYQL
ncbi:helicase with zinc finger domain 2-like isoform X2 [Parambassis ranga]|nr:helicase with zinc finger domain 2 isoform X2 [Parambassis ranga]